MWYWSILKTSKLKNKLKILKTQTLLKTDVKTGVNINS